MAFTIFIVFFVMLLIVVAMSVGVLMGRKPISGSCGGMSSLGMEVACDICGGDTAKCDKENQTAADNAPSETQFYEASK